MTSARNSLAAFQNGVDKRKRLGQYFTGDRLARLLAVISDAASCRSVIDPMCGKGDMLAAVRGIAPSTKLAGIEIDPNAMALCAARFGEDFNRPHLILGNAFSWATISKLPTHSYDLVITNPPYVRYQSLSATDHGWAEDLPNSESIRCGLLEIAHRLDGLDDTDREIFISVIKGYSGLSDLAVPSWILCAMLTAVGGNLAMVVPESWLSRDYACPIHYLLLKLFRIRWVIEDTSSIWFGSAQVKTNLLVAQRLKRADDIQAACAGQSYLHIALPASTMDERSVVGSLYPHTMDPDASFAKELVRLSTDTKAVCKAGFSFTRRSLANKLTDLVAIAGTAEWLCRCEPALARVISSRPVHIRGSARIPQALLDLIPAGHPVGFSTLKELGVQVGQGLRTGANVFFYCDLIAEIGDSCLVKPNKKLNVPSVLIPKEALRPVLRKQQEAPKGYQLDASSLRGRVLVLENFVHPDDLRRVPCQIRFEFDPQRSRKVMPPSLAAFVTLAAQTNVGTPHRPKLIPQLSAVRTNETKQRDNNEIARRYWYMLPPLVRRHLPDLFVPRVNNLHPRVMLNSPERTVIDANFSTLWLNPDATIDSYAVLACLNSSWAIASMELIGTVMGGGALKLEATHLRQLPIPMLPDEKWNKLSALGRELVSGNSTGETLACIDYLICEVIFGSKRAGSALEAIRQIKAEKLAARKKGRIR